MDGEIESAIETLEILSDSETLKAIEDGLQDIKAGRVIRFKDHSAPAVAPHYTC